MIHQFSWSLIWIVIWTVYLFFYYNDVSFFLAEPNLQVLYSSSAKPKCHSSCRLPDRSSFIWYKNGQKIQDQTSSTYGEHHADSYSCAVEGFEHHPAPPVCEFTTQSPTNMTFNLLYYILDVHVIKKLLKSESKSH